jgi:hypothetical protein
VTARSLEKSEERTTGSAPDGSQTAFDTEVTEARRELSERAPGALYGEGPGGQPCGALPR